MPQDRLYIRSVVVPARLGRPQYEIENPTLDDILATQPLLSDLVNENEQMVLRANLLVFFDRLRKAADLYRKHEHRAEAIAAVDAAINLISRFDPGVCENLAAPLLSLNSALTALNFGTVEPVLQPKRDEKGGNTPDSMERQDLIGTAVATVRGLQWTGLPLKQAHKAVANTLNNVRFSARSGSVTARTVRYWCEIVAADLGKHSIAARAASAMLTDDHKAGIKSLPLPEARKRLLKMLATYAEISAGSILEKPPKSVS